MRVSERFWGGGTLVTFAVVWPGRQVIMLCNPSVGCSPAVAPHFSQEHPSVNRLAFFGVIAAAAISHLSLGVSRGAPE